MEAKAKVDAATVAQVEISAPPCRQGVASPACADPSVHSLGRRWRRRRRRLRWASQALQLPRRRRRRRRCSSNRSLGPRRLPATYAATTSQTRGATAETKAGEVCVVMVFDLHGMEHVDGVLYFLSGRRYLLVARADWRRLLLLSLPPAGQVRAWGRRGRLGQPGPRRGAAE